MASAFALTLAYLGEECSSMDAGGAFAAYITGNVASNLIGRLMSAALADTLGLASNFYFFALLNLAGAALVYFTVSARQADAGDAGGAVAVRGKDRALAQPVAARRLRASASASCSLSSAPSPSSTSFWCAQPLSLGRMDLGFVYFVFAPSVVTTLFAGSAVARFGTRPAIWGALALAAIGLPMMLSSHLAARLAGMVLVGVGTFFAQAAATGFVGQAAQDNRGVASGTYLACYFFGGMVGSAVLGQLFDRFGWSACVAGVGASLAIAAMMTTQLKLPSNRGEAPMMPATTAD